MKTIKQYKRVESDYWYDIFKDKNSKEETDTALNFLKEIQINKYLNKDMKGLDVGCGNGRFLLAMDELGYKDIQGIDLDIDLINISKKKKLKVKQNDVRRLEYKDNTFDYVLEIGTIEHLEYDSKQALNEIYRVLKPGGYLFLSLSHMNEYRQRIRSYIYIRNQIKRLVGDKFHQFIYTPKEAFKLLYESGFTTIDSFNRGSRLVLVGVK